jgi:hypothetical protein
MEFDKFLQSESVEEKIVGLVRCQSFLHEKILSNVEYNFPESLELIVSSVTPQFLVQMLHTHFVGPSFTIQDVSLSIFEIIMSRHPSLLKRFIAFRPEICNLVFTEVSFATLHFSFDHLFFPYL